MQSHIYLNWIKNLYLTFKLLNTFSGACSLIRFLPNKPIHRGTTKGRWSYVRLPFFHSFRCPEIFAIKLIAPIKSKWSSYAWALFNWNELCFFADSEIKFDWAVLLNQDANKVVKLCCFFNNFGNYLYWVMALTSATPIQ